jgi:uroporphyrinogen-III synthase
LADGRTVLVTRPEPGAAETAARLLAMGFTPVSAPMLTIRPRAPLPARPVAPQAILVTSANAIPALPAAWRARPLLAVGDATAARAVAAGFTRVESAGADAAALAALVIARCRPHGGALLLASGMGQGLTLAASLRAAGFTVQRRIAYAARPAESLPAPAAAALAAGRVGTILFFSPATARGFVVLLQRAGLPICGVEALAISQAAAIPLALLPWRGIRVASHPNQDALLALLA